VGNQTVDRQGPLDNPVSGSQLMHGSGRSPRRYIRAQCFFVCLAIALAGVPRGAASVEDPPASTQSRTNPAESWTQPPLQAQPAAQSTAGIPAAAASSAPEAIDRQPYRIELHLSFDPSARIDQARRANLLRQWQAQVHRFVGPPWIISVAVPSSPLASGNLETLDAGAFSKFDSSFDKIWLVRISAASPAPGLVFTGREYDTATRRLGPLQEHAALVLADAPRAMLQFALELFSPTALITGQEGGRALLLVRGGSIAPASQMGKVVSKGTVFIPLRLISMRDNSIAIRRIAFTYLQAQETEGARARCAIISHLRDPLTQRVALPNTLAALGIKPGNNTLRLRFLNRTDLAPAAGYALFARAVPDGLAHELGMTDRAGRIALKPGFADGLVVLRLVAGTAEPLVEFPMMPGESTEEREITIDPMPLAVGYQVQLDALRDEVIDLVAQRSRLEKRMEARLQGDDLEGLELGLKEYVQLPPRDRIADRLSKMKEQADMQQAKSKTPVLSKNIQARFSELQALIDRYLDNEAFQSYTEALEQKRAERSGAAKTKNRTRGQIPAVTADAQSKASGEIPQDPAPKPQPNLPAAQPKTSGPPF
jgi:hypothetical protein